MYGQEEIWKTHEENLSEFANYSIQEGIPPLVLTFPYLNRIEPSAPYTQLVVDFFRSRDVKTIDYAQLLNGRAPHTLVVNKLDPHPGIELNKEIADHVYHWIQKNRF